MNQEWAGDGSWISPKFKGEGIKFPASVGDGDGDDVTDSGTGTGMVIPAPLPSLLNSMGLPLHPTSLHFILIEKKV